MEHPSMAELSPQAQAVLEAAYESLDRRGYVSDQVAAALRAAAQFNPGPFVPELFDDGWKAAMAELQYIADQLEAS